MKINSIYINYDYTGVALEPPVSRARLSVTPASPPKVLELVKNKRYTLFAHASCLKLSGPKRFETKVLKNLSLITTILNAKQSEASLCHTNTNSIFRDFLEECNS